MQIEFRGNHLYTNIRVIGSINTNNFDFLIDTGATKSGIPLDKCQSLGLRLSGTERTEGLYGVDYLPLFDARLEIANRPAFDTQIIGLPANICLLGVDVLSKYKIHIDWLSNPRTARVDY